MPELRKDPILGRWVIIAPERSKRPTYFHVPEVAAAEEDLKREGCPFCPGNEQLTLPEILAYRPDQSQADTAGWTLRVIPNKFPFLAFEGELEKEGVGLYDRMNGVGSHEVLIETPEHNSTLASLSLSKFEDVLWAFRDRISSLRHDEKFKYVLIFKNQGRAAGATLEHPHSQVIALPVVPKAVVDEMNGSEKYFHYRDRCIYCDIIRQDAADGMRVIEENEDFIAITPFAPIAPYEFWILPEQHYSIYEQINRRQIENLARIFLQTLRKMDAALDNPPYNFMLHTAPLGDESNEYYHWHFEVMPKLSIVAGFEWGSGFYINPIPPEDSARLLREQTIHS